MKISFGIKKKIRQLKNRLLKLINARNPLIRVYLDLLKVGAREVEPGVSCVIFSMDRALQLHALLASFIEQKNGNCEIVVLYRTTSDRHQKSYEDVFTIYGSAVKFVKHDSKFDFKKKLVAIVTSLTSGKLFFLVDDIIFTEKVDMSLLENVDTRRFIFSLRMGAHLNYSYVVNKVQPLPVFSTRGDFLTWNWEVGELDWNYPLSVDGHLFNKNEIAVLCEILEFSSPTSFEEVLQSVKDVFSKRTGMSYVKAAILNNPCNKVQDEVNNFYGAIHQDALLEHWENGKQINYQKIYGYKNNSVHEEITFSYIERDGK